MRRVPRPILLKPTARFHVLNPPSDAISVSPRKAVFGRDLVLGRGVRWDFSFISPFKNNCHGPPGAGHPGDVFSNPVNKTRHGPARPGHPFSSVLSFLHRFWKMDGRHKGGHDGFLFARSCRTSLGGPHQAGHDKRCVLGRKTKKPRRISARTSVEAQFENCLFGTPGPTRCQANYPSV
jgi:hypothetical protein